MDDHLTPAHLVITRFGGVRETARKLGISSSTVSRWRKPRPEGGTGGKIPTKHQERIFALAAELGCALTPAQIMGVAE